MLESELRTDQEVDGCCTPILHTGADGATALSSALQVSCRLTHLRLEFDSIGDGGAAALADVLWNPVCSLRHLYLLSIGMGGQGAARLAEPLTVNSTLVHLNLAGNQVGDLGAKTLAAALETNLTLQHLTLVSNAIGHEGATALSRALASNCTLMHLDLKGNSSSLNSESAAELSLALASNQSLSFLGLEPPIFGSSRKQIAVSLARALLQRPPPAQQAFTINGITLADAAPALQLPPPFEHADNAAILQHFWRAQEHGCRCIEAFAMALHPRLGHASSAHVLNDPILTVVQGHLDVSAWLDRAGEGHGHSVDKERREARTSVLRKRLAAAVETALEAAYAFSVRGPAGAGWSAGLRELEPLERQVEELLKAGPVARVSYAYSPPDAGAADLQTGSDCVMLVDICVAGAVGSG